MTTSTNRRGAFGFALLSLVWLVAPSRAVGTSARGCAGAKMIVTGKLAAAMLGCQARAARGGVAVNAACLDKARTRLTSRFASLEKRGGCAITGDASRVTVMLDSSVGAFVAALRPSAAADRCAARKLDATGKKAKGKLRCHGEAARGGSTADAACLTKAETQFAAAFAAAEHSVGCLTTHDADDVESAVDDFVGKVVAAMVPHATTTTTTTTTIITITTSSTSTTTLPCAGRDAFRCGDGIPPRPCCGTDLCEFSLYGSSGVTQCVPCIRDFVFGWGSSYGCNKDADCCTPGYRCLSCRGYVGDGVCLPPAPQGPNGCALSGSLCCPDGTETECCNGVCTENGTCP